MEVRILGDYEIIKSIGQGSLGTVYLAQHRFMKTQYALKVLPEELAADRSFIQRFEEDVNLLAALDHPHIVKIHNISFAHGQYFIVMDCIVDDLGETTNLAQYMLAHGKKFEEEQIYQILLQVAEALDYAHAKKGGTKGIVHRNLKLNNILVGKSKGGLQVFLSDFGLSRIIGSSAVLTRTFKNVAEALGIGSLLYSQKTGQDRYPHPAIETQKLIPLHSSFMQNFAFLAPEQKKIDHPHPIDAKADNFAFGILAYYLMMGEIPEGYFPMPSSRNPTLQCSWDSLLKHCLQPDPVHRPDLLVPLLQSAWENTLGGISQENLGNSPESRTFASYALEAPAYQEAIVVSVTETSSSGKLMPVLKTSKIERPDLDMNPHDLLRVDTTVKQYHPESKEIKNIQPLLTEMVVIPGGTYYRGSNDGNRDETPRHRVILSDYAIDIHPVTNEQFVRFLDAMGGEKDQNHNDIIRMKDSRIKKIAGRLSIESGYAKHPVVGVTWYGAVAYAKWVGKRLPTEAEWEVAARGGLDDALYSTGDDIEKTQANFFSSDTTTVMSYAPNGYGIYDTAGNVYEWVYDWYGYNYYELSVQEPNDPKGPLQGVYRVLRGGCWKSLKEDLRCSRRHRNNPGTVNGTYGFRCATDVERL